MPDVQDIVHRLPPNGCHDRLNAISQHDVIGILAAFGKMPLKFFQFL